MKLARIVRVPALDFVFDAMVVVVETTAPVRAMLRYRCGGE
jgi:hypothetical protein